MAQYDIPLLRQGGFGSLAEAKAHRSVVTRLTEQIDLARSVADDWREADRVDVGTVGSELYKDLAPGKGHVIMLTQPEGAPLMGAELHYDPETGVTRRLVVDQGDVRLTQQGSAYKLEEHGVTTYFRLDPERQVLTVWDAESEVPRIFGGADPVKLTGGALQLSKPIVLF